MLLDGGIGEYEDDSEYAPSGCVSFLTIHQSKGMEFPIVIVDSLGSVPRKDRNDLLDGIIDKFGHKDEFEPLELTKFYDFWRLYYTAFSRAQDLLILTANETSRVPSKYFRDVYEELVNYSNNAVDLSEFNFKKIKDVNLKESFSFTSHIAVYETCSLQYKFYKELEFMPVRAGAMLFGQLVHQTIEDVHKAILRGEEKLVNPDSIGKWFDLNYSNLSKSTRTYLGEPQRRVALEQVLRYADKQKNYWNQIISAEVDVSLVMPDYILEGSIDLIRGEDNTYEIVDFKSEKKPDVFSDVERIERYQNQLNVYAYLVEKRMNVNVSNMHLYFTGEVNGKPTITFTNNKKNIDTTISNFSKTVEKILNREYNTFSDSLKICDSCDFRFYCNKK